MYIITATTNAGSFRANFTAEEQNEIVYTLPEVLKE